jgi:hypothetical protein
MSLFLRLAWESFCVRSWLFIDDGACVEWNLMVRSSLTLSYGHILGVC